MSVFGDAIMASMVADTNPEAKKIAKAMDAKVRSMNTEAVLVQASAIGEIEQLLKAAEDNKARASVITGYEKLIAELSG